MNRKRSDQIKHAQKLSRKIELACEGNLFEWFDGSHIGTYGGEHRNLEKAYAVFGDCPWTELEFDAKENKAYVFVGYYGKARIPQRAVPALHAFFSALHNC